MTHPLHAPSMPLDIPTRPEDDGSFTLPKLKAASESLRVFNDALLRIEEAEAEASGEKRVGPNATPSGAPNPAT